MRRITALLAAFLLLSCTPSFGRPQAHPSAKPSTTPSAAASLEAFVPVAEAFVEQHRGLKFKAPVKVIFLGDAEFQAALAKGNGSDTAGYTTEAKVLHALGLLDGRPDLAKAEQSLQDSSVIGFYDSKTKELYVRGVDAKPSVRHVLVHELTHALQDQWFSIDRTMPTDDESDLAFRSLVEGDAVRIESQYISTLSAGDKREIQAADAAGGPPPAGVPQILLELDYFPYQAGPPFTEAVASAGQDRLDAAFTTPPVSTAQVIHPGLYLAGKAPVTIDFPPADRAVIDKGVLGEFGLDLLLERLNARGQVTIGQVQTISSGWSGDRYVAWDKGSESCVRTRFQMSNAQATTDLLAALHKFAGDHAGSSVSGTDPVLFTACA
ncbi:MAG: hypothetical protein M3Z98_07935 [Candidatus Dormibacteraeota bacterium]|nr:hypothetical protein [Candidatus Dormibacteraeota bacterium]